MPRPLKPAPRFWWWPRVSPAFALLCLGLVGVFALLQLFRLGAGTYFILAFLWLPVGELFRQRAKLAERVLERPGETCPCCLHELETDAPSCTRCKAGYSRAVYADYWAMVAKTPSLSEPWWRAMNKAEGVRGRATHLTLAARWQFGLLGVCFVLTIVGVVMWRPVSLLSLDILWMMPLYLGVGLGLWVKYNYGSRRAGSSLHCAKCDYQIDPSRLEMTTCPECGSGLTGHDQTAVGRRVGYRGYSHLGNAIMAVVGLLFLGSLVGGMFSRALSPSHYLPVSIYVADALSGDSDYKTWDVLESRYAKPKDLQRLVDALMVWMQDSSAEDDFRFSYGISESLAFQLDGPHATDAMKQEVALGLLTHSKQPRLYDLNNWLENYLQSLSAGSAEHQALLAAAEEAFFAGTLDIRLRSWLEGQRGHPLRMHNEMGRFCQDMLFLEVKQESQGSTLIIRTNPHIALSPGLLPDAATTAYVLLVPPDGFPGPTSAEQIVPSTLRYDPFAHLGQAHTLATIPLDVTYPEALDYRLRFVVYVGEVELPARFMQWYDGWPTLPQNVVPDRQYGPMELAPGRSTAHHTSLRLRR